ncbi:HEAT repeat domain-containing protein [Streptomyces sp. NPDC059479]|uniref:HEAT repeat domain-containing protein n=1 Tax=Streptomyces sp. NPDC059479 TaxID=3346848 RepID=UPI0036B008A7
MSKTPGVERSSAPPSSALAAFTEALTRTATDAREADHDLVASVRDMDAVGEFATALRILAERPALVLRLDTAVRRTDDYRYGHAARAGRAGVATASAIGTSPLGVALASCHPDGRVRERAVCRQREILSRPQPPAGLMPFLVLRTTDWARPVRDAARAALAVLLHDAPERLVPTAAPAALLISRRARADFARQQVLAALMSSPTTTVFEQLLASPNPRLRQFALQTALADRRLPLRTLIALAGHDTHRRCRELAAESAVREAVWTERTDLIRQLAATRYPEVRALALVGLIRTGLTPEVTSHLDDASVLVRALARDAVRRSGGDALGHYRAAVRSPTPGVIAGLAETGRTADAELLTPLLDHPRSHIRMAALRGLRTLDAVPVGRAVPLLRDPSTKVIREATAALRTRINQLPAGLAQSLLADRDRAAVRRAGYRLLNEPDLVQRLRTALSLVRDPDSRLARRATDDVAALIRTVHPSPWRTKDIPDFDPTPDERLDLLSLTEAAATALPHRTHQLLLEHLDPTAPSTELIRVRYGPHPDTKNPLLEVEATFTAQDPHAAIALMRDVLLAVLPYTADPATTWPTDDQWRSILPTWFVERCAPETPVRQGTAADWLAWWRGPTQQQRETEMKTDAVADWRLSDWINLFDPDAMADVRSWRWWDTGVRTTSTGWVRFGTDGHPYGGRGALLWLIEAAGGYDIDLP